MGLKYGVWRTARASGKCADVSSWNLFGAGRFHPLVSLHFEMDLLTSSTNSAIGNWWRKPAIVLLEGAVQLVQ